MAAVIKINDIIYGSTNAADIFYNEISVADKLDEIISIDVEDNVDIDNAQNDNLTYSHIVDNLTSDDTNKVLSAKQGKILNEKFNNIDFSSIEAKINENKNSINDNLTKINKNTSDIANNLTKINTNTNNITTLNNKIPFSFGVDANGNYGYIKDGADTVIPFSQMAKGTSTYSGYSKATKVTLGWKPRAVMAYCTSGNGYIISWFYAEGLLNYNLRRSSSNYSQNNFITVDDTGFSWTSIDSIWGTQTITYVAIR